jgi:hypothetical protein
MAARPETGEPHLTRFGITLSNRGIQLGLTTVPKLLALRRRCRGLPAAGWMTHSVSPSGFRRSLDVILRAGEDAGREMACRFWSDAARGAVSGVRRGQHAVIPPSTS